MARRRTTQPNIRVSPSRPGSHRRVSGVSPAARPLEKCPRNNENRARAFRPAPSPPLGPRVMRTKSGPAPSGPCHGRRISWASVAAVRCCRAHHEPSSPPPAAGPQRRGPGHQVGADDGTRAAAPPKPLSHEALQCARVPGPQGGRHASRHTARRGIQQPGASERLHLWPRGPSPPGGASTIVELSPTSRFLRIRLLRLAPRSAGVDHQPATARRTARIPSGTRPMNHRTALPTPRNLEPPLQAKSGSAVLSFSGITPTSSRRSFDPSEPHVSGFPDR